MQEYTYQMISHTYHIPYDQNNIEKNQKPKKSNHIYFFNRIKSYLTTRTLCLMVGYRVLESKLSDLEREGSNMFEPIHQDPFPSLLSFRLLLLHLRFYSCMIALRPLLSVGCLFLWKYIFRNFISSDPICFLDLQMLNVPIKTFVW